MALHRLGVTQNASVKAVANSVFGACKLLSEDQKIGCYANEMRDVSYLFGDTYAFTVLGELEKRDLVAKGCHFIAHGIGWGVWQRDPSNWQNAIVESSPLCTYGEQMGIIEKYTESLPKGQFTEKDVSNLCGSNPKGDCNHAVGHMMLLQASANLSRAIEFCSGLHDSNPDLNSNQNFMCLTGVFMERIIASNLLEHGLVSQSWRNWPARLSDDERLCRQYSGNYSVACWREISHAAFYYFNQGPKKIFDYCDTAPNHQAALFCKEHALAQLVTTYKSNITAMKSVCAIENRTDPAFEKQCYVDLVGIRIAFLGPDQNYTFNYCNSLANDLVPVCFARENDTLWATFPDEVVYVNDRSSQNVSSKPE